MADNNHDAEPINQPINLPAAPLGNIINLPPAPQNPPTNDDLVKATNYAKDIFLGEARGTASATDVRNAQVYHLKILQAVGDQEVAPPWFQIAMAHMNERLDRLEGAVNRISRSSAMAYNLSVGRGDILPLQEVPFHDSSWPTEGGLPLLDTVDVLNALDAATLRAYFRGYYPVPAPLPALQEDRRQAVRNAIGCLRKN